MAEATDADAADDDDPALGARELPQRLARPRPAHEAAVHGCHAGGLPVRLAPAGAGRQPQRDRARRQNDFLNLLNTFSGGGLTRLSVFALGIMPYITASIILQVMTPVFPSLQALQKEGELGQRQDHPVHPLPDGGAGGRAVARLRLRLRQRLQPARRRRQSATCWSTARCEATCWWSLTLTAGATLLMWIGELITQRGIGNGMSLLIFASILTSAPAGINAWWNGSPLREAVAADRDPGRHHRRRLRAGGHPQDPDPVRQADGRAADDLGRRRPTCRCA